MLSTKSDGSAVERKIVSRLLSRAMIGAAKRSPRLE